VKADFASSEIADRFAVAEFESTAGIVVPQSPSMGTSDKATTSVRRFLFVSMPFGPFGRELANSLRSAGAHVTRVLLNGGDVFDWGLHHTASYFGASSGWPRWLTALIQREHITDIVTYGDSSPHANVALSVASELGVRSHVFEQGYFRPDWITLDACGVNANSALPRVAEWYRNHPAALRHAEAKGIGRTMPAAVRHIVAYHIAMYFGVFFFPRYKAHYTEAAFKQAAGHLARYGLQLLSQKREKKAYDDVAGGENPVFLCVLQRPGDSQLWRHSEYAAAPVYIDRVISSFASHAPKNARLVIRSHPLDPGLVPHRAIVAQTARKYSVSHRVRLTDYGKLHEILPGMTGVVCINSTAGLAAVEFGKPTITLGQAMYDMHGLTHQGDLDGFWGTPQPPDAALYNAFRRVVIAETQINGAYATSRGRRMAVPESARRLLSSRH
jgi:capsular polysaccharide export protein